MRRINVIYPLQVNPEECSFGLMGYGVSYYFNDKYRNQEKLLDTE